MSLDVESINVLMLSEPFFGAILLDIDFIEVLEQRPMASWTKK
jgi:hypothetical protein